MSAEIKNPGPKGPGFVYVEMESYYLVCCVGLHVDKLASFLAGGENYNTVNEGEEGVILTHAYVETGVMGCAALTLKDVASLAL